MNKIVSLCALAAAPVLALGTAQAQTPDHSAFAADTPTSTCFGCHGSYADVAKQTASLKPNPHDSHRGKPGCMECHAFTKGQKPVFMCNDCHAFPTEADGFHLKK